MRRSIAKHARTAALLCFTCATCALAAEAQPSALQCDPAQTTAKFTLGDVLHSVHGAFKVKRCDIRFDPTSNKLDGEIVFDATSGESGNASRVRKMQKNVLETAIRRSCFGRLTSRATLSPPAHRWCRSAGYLVFMAPSTRSRFPSR